MTVASEPARLHRRRPLLRRWLLWAVLASLFAFGAFVMLSTIGAASGVRGTVLGLALSLVVVGIVVPVLLWVDRFESEPTGMLLFAFGWGACIATVGAAIFNDVGGYLLGATGEGNAVVALAVAPVVEETFKALGPVLLLIFRRREIDGILDGIVYAGLSACGFAFVEDILYLANGYAESGDRGLLGTFVVRVLMSPFAHPMFTICTGIGIGIAATSRTVLPRFLAPLIGWCCAVFLHSVWNASALASTSGEWFVVYLVVQVPLFAGFATVLILARRREAHLIGVELSTYADAGLITPAEVAMLSSMKERRNARAWAGAHGGKPARRQMHEYQDAASELALLRHRMRRERPDRDELDEQDRLVWTISQLRAPFVGSAIYRRYETLGHL